MLFDSFIEHSVVARRDIIDLFLGYGSREFAYQDILRNPSGWASEIMTIQRILTGRETSVGVQDAPPSGEGAETLGEDVLFYRGSDLPNRGLWVRVGNFWEHYDAGTHGVVLIDKKYRDVSPDQLNPENFFRHGKIVKDEKRPIVRFVARADKMEVPVYAKGSCRRIQYYYNSRPSGRLTSIEGVGGMTAIKEMERTLELAGVGIKVPEVVGAYLTAAEDFSFYREVEGKSPDHFVESHRDEIIDQDAQMLAALCSLGLRKIRFTDSDDKVFDGKNLVLIDVDETRDILGGNKHGFTRATNLSGLSPKARQEISDLQRERTLRELKDALFTYKRDLLRESAQKRKYIEEFYKRMGWENPKAKDFQELTEFPLTYLTLDQAIEFAAAPEF